MTPESAIVLVEQASDKVVTDITVETHEGGRIRPLTRKQSADSVDETHEVFVDFTGCWLNPISSPGWGALAGDPSKVWRVRE